MTRSGRSPSCSALSACGRCSSRAAGTACGRCSPRAALTPSGRPSRSWRAEGGQAAVEFVAVLPLVALLGLLCWQAVLAGQAVWLSGAAARAAARADALGHDPGTAARRVLPAALAERVRAWGDGAGSVTVRLGIPAVVGGIELTSITARARFASQAG